MKKIIKHLIKISHCVQYVWTVLICVVIVSVFLCLSNYWICLFATHDKYFSKNAMPPVGLSKAHIHS